ncbi:MAG: hypothetical protein Q9202_007317 [Teloschistes flavicans]
MPRSKRPLPDHVQSPDPAKPSTKRSRPATRQVQEEDKEDIDKRREASKRKLKSRFQDIYNKYGREFEVADEIDLPTLEITVNGGHVDRMRHETDVGDGSTLESYGEEDLEAGSLWRAKGMPKLWSVNAAARPQSSPPLLDDIGNPLSRSNINSDNELHLNARGQSTTARCFRVEIPILQSPTTTTGATKDDTIADASPSIAIPQSRSSRPTLDEDKEPTTAISTAKSNGLLSSETSTSQDAPIQTIETARKTMLSQITEPRSGTDQPPSSDNTPPETSASNDIPQGTTKSQREASQPKTTGSLPDRRQSSTAQDDPPSKANAKDQVSESVPGLCRFATTNTKTERSSRSLRPWTPDEDKLMKHHRGGKEKTSFKDMQQHFASDRTIVALEQHASFLGLTKKRVARHKRAWSNKDDTIICENEELNAITIWKRYFEHRPKEGGEERSLGAVKSRLALLRQQLGRGAGKTSIVDSDGEDKSQRINGGSRVKGVEAGPRQVEDNNEQVICQDVENGMAEDREVEDKEAEITEEEAEDDDEEKASCQDEEDNEDSTDEEDGYFSVQDDEDEEGTEDDEDESHRSGSDNPDRDIQALPFLASTLRKLRQQSPLTFEEIERDGGPA